MCTVNNHDGSINKICWPISKKTADFIVENRTCSLLDDKIVRFYRPTKSVDFCITDDRFFGWPILLSDKIGQLYRSCDIRLTVVTYLRCSIYVYFYREIWSRNARLGYCRLLDMRQIDLMLSLTGCPSLCGRPVGSITRLALSFLRPSVCLSVCMSPVGY